MEAIIFIGIQAAGKSTFYRERFFDTHLRINLDMLRTRHRERLLVEACIAARQRFVIDNTNPTAEERARYIDRARSAGFTIVGYYFQSSAIDAAARNSARRESSRVPERAIYGTRKRLQPPTLAEGFDRLHGVTIDPEYGFIVQEMTDGI